MTKCGVTVTSALPPGGVARKTNFLKELWQGMNNNDKSGSRHVNNNSRVSLKPASLVSTPLSPQAHHLDRPNAARVKERGGEERAVLFLPKPERNKSTRSRSSSSSCTSESSLMTTSTTRWGKGKGVSLNSGMPQHRTFTHKTKQPCWRRRPLRQLLRVMLPVPLRFEDDQHEEKFAWFIQVL